MKFLHCLLLFPLGLLAQSHISCVLIDAEGYPIPACNIVYLNRNLGTTSSVNGFFSLPFIAGDSIQITNVGYKPIIVPSSVFKSGDSIVLEKLIINLENVLVINFEGFKNIKQVGFAGFKKNGNIKYGPGSQVAAFIENKEGKDGWVKGLEFFISSFVCQTDMRIRLLACSKNKFFPAEDMIGESIIVKHQSLRKHNQIDLSAYKIIFPPEGLFAMIEWLDPADSCTEKKYPVLTATYRTEYNVTFRNYRDRGWMLNVPPVKGRYYFTPCIGLKVAY